jgi:hypothetical protein
MVIVAESFYPAISGLNRETTSKALSCEQLIPIILTIRQSIFQVKWVVSKCLTTISTQEAFWMEMLANCIQAISFDLGAAFITSGSQVLLKAIFTIQFSLLLYKTNVCQWATTLGIDTFKMVWTPVLAQCSDEWASDL